MIEIEIKNGKITVTMDLHEQLSSTGKMLLIASTGGFKNTDIEYKGKPVKINLMAGIYANK